MKHLILLAMLVAVVDAAPRLSGSEKAALKGATTGSRPGASNRFVTDDDSRLVASGMATSDFLEGAGVTIGVEGDSVRISSSSLSGYSSDLEVAYLTANTVGITVTTAALTDGTTTQLFDTVNETVDISASVGPGGPDAEGLDSVSAWRSIWLIGKTDGTIDGLLSASATSPTLPSGYTLKTRVGWVRNNGSSNFIDFVKHDRRVSWRTASIAIVTGAAPTSATALDGTSVAPPDCRFILISSAVTKATAGAPYVSARERGTSHYITIAGVYTNNAWVYQGPHLLAVDAGQLFDYVTGGSASSSELYSEGYIDAR